MTLKSLCNRLAGLLAWCWHRLVWIGAACVLLAAVAVLALRYWVLPNIENYREDSAQSVSKAAGQRVTIGSLTADWDGLRPRLNLGNVVVYDKVGRAALTLQKVESTVSWRSVIWQRPLFHALDLYEPALDIRRDKNGVLSVAGIEMGGESRGGGFSDWVLSQRDIEIHNAAIDWTDEMRDAAVLQLRTVNMQLVNRGERHRFGLTAVPPRALAGPLDVRGDVVGKSLKNIVDWHGRLYAQLDNTDIAEWQQWIPFPFEFNRGAGALRAWAVIRDQTLQELTADVRLSDVRTRLGKDLPELDLTVLNGRLGWKKSVKGLEFSMTQLGLTTAGNLTLAPLDFSYKAATDAKGALLGGEIKCNALDLAPVMSLADHLPFSPGLRKRLADLSPRGRLYDMTAKWAGELPTPSTYSARGRFEELAVLRLGELPGLKGISGNFEASDSAGTATIASRAVQFDMPEIFKAPLTFDTVTGQTSWTRDGKTYRVRLANIEYANADLAGTLSGTYQSVPQRPGIADVAGKLTRADARRVTRYLPLPVAGGARGWLEDAFVAGTSNDVNFQVKGDLYEFPFEDPKQGVFLVNAKVAGGVLHYGDAWPNIENIEGDLAFRGKRMDMVARQGFISGVRLSAVRAEIADLAQQRVLVVTGEGEGTTPDFLKFIAISPVAGYIDRFTDGMQGEGAGKLQLRLELPLKDINQTRVAGSYQMNANRLVLDAGMPPLEQVSGKIEFTESGLNVPAANGQFIGGPLAISGATQRDGTLRVNLQGRADPDTLQRAGGPAWLSQVRGATDWRGTVTVRKKTVDLILESNLQGLASTLPAPLAKSAADALPLRFERKFVNNERDQLALSVGDILSTRLHRHREGKRTVIDRGVVLLGGGVAAEPERDGIHVSGSLKSVNLDSWLKLASPGAAAAGGEPDYVLAGLDVKLGELEVFDRKFGELAIATTRVDAGTTRYTLAGRELEGTADWNPQGRGRLMARLKKLTLPAATPATKVETAPAKEAPQLPALDVVAENFQLGARILGKLELKATQQERDWRIDELRLSNPDGTMVVNGVWQSWLTNPRTQVTVQWGVLDIGKTLARLGYPDGVRRGSAEIGGTFAWNGAPYQIDYPSLSGKFAMRAVNGQFVKMDPGIGKLLGIISLQSLPRRLTLDFRDLFSEGFAFNEILSEVKVDNGIAAADKFLIEGPSAKVLMGGTVDLNRETQNLQVKVSPHVSDGVSLATALLGGPIAALATFVASKLLKDPLDDLVAIRYTVTGGWADPVVARVVPPASTAAPPVE